MKKALNFRTILVCVLVLVMCVACFVACDKTKNQYDETSLNNAKNYLRTIYEDLGPTTPSNFDVIVKAPGKNGVMHDVEWTVAVSTEGQEASITVVPGTDKATIQVPEKATEDISYTLTATIKDGEHNLTLVFNLTVPKWRELTWAEYMGKAANEAVIVKGKVASISSKSTGDKYNLMYIYDADGGYYIYSLTEDPLTTYPDLKIGMTVQVTGTKDIYNGTHEVKNATFTVLDATSTIDFADITEVFAATTDMKAEALTNKAYMPVVIKNVIIGDIDTASSYYYFSIGASKSYLRVSSSDNMLSADETQAFKDGFAALNGKYATVKGMATVYNGAFYIQVITTDAAVEQEAPAKDPAGQIEDVKGRLAIDTTISGSGRTFNLPTQDTVYTDVKIAWTASSEVAAIADGKVTYTFTEDGTVTLTATLTHATDATVSDTKTFEVSLSVGTAITVEDFYKAAKSDSVVYILTGYVVAAGGNHTKAGSFVFADATGSVFSYEKAQVEVGDYVQVIGTRDEQYSLAQLKTISVKQLTGGSFVEATPEEINVANVKVDGSTLYTNQFYKIVGGKLAVETSNGKTYYNLYNGTTKMVAFYGSAALETEMKALDGKEVVVYGYSRGVNTSNKYWQVQVTRITEKEKTDAEKLAQAKDELTSVTGDGSVAFSDSFTLVTEGAYGTTIAWRIKEAGVTALTIDGATATVTKPETDVALTLVATISIAGSEEAAVEKEFPITITATIPTYTVTITPVTGATITVMNGSEEVVSGATLNKGTELVITVVVDTDHRLGAVKDGETTLTAETDGSYKLTLVAEANITVELKNAYSCLVEGEEIKTFAQLQELIPNPGDSTSEKYYTMGYIKSVDNDKYGNLTLVDGDGNTFIIYGSYSYDGSTKYDALPTKPVVDDFVVLVGVLTNYNGTYEMKNACLCQLNDQLYAPTLAEQVAQAKTALTLEASYHANFNLPLTGANGTTITWAPKTETTVVVINAETGEVTINPVDPSTTITLVATIQKGSASDTKEIDVVILKETPKYTVSWTVGENGTLTSAMAGETALTSGDEVEVDTVVTFVVAPQDGYRLASVTIGEGTADTSVAGQTTFDVTVTANTTVAIAFEVIPSTTTVTRTIADLADANSWANSTQYKSVALDTNVTASVTGGGNTGKYYTNGEEWRVYQSESPTIKIEVATGYSIVSVKITYSISNTGIMINGSDQVKSGTVVTVNATSISFGVGNTGTATNGQVKITAIEVVYEAVSAE